MSISDLCASIGTTLKFSGRNYAIWSQAFLTFLSSQGHDHNLVQTMANTQDPKYGAWRQSNCAVKTWLLNSFKPKIVAFVGLISTTKEMWDSIKEMLSNDGSDTTKKHLQQQLSPKILVN